MQFFVSNSSLGYISFSEVNEPLETCIATSEVIDVQADSFLSMELNKLNTTDTLLLLILLVSLLSLFLKIFPSRRF